MGLIQKPFLTLPKLTDIFCFGCIAFVSLILSRGWEVVVFGRSYFKENPKFNLDLELGGGVN